MVAEERRTTLSACFSILRALIMALVASWPIRHPGISPFVERTRKTA